LLRDKDEKIIGSRPCTRRIRLRWEVDGNPSKIGELFDTYVVLVAPRTGGKGLFLGRPLHSVKTDAALIRRWILYCEVSHGDACKSQTQGIPLSKSFFGVIDVTEMCLTKLPDGARYIALSYTWGQGGHHFKTTALNVRDHLKPGGLRKMDLMMPRTIRDAINLVRDLGERYLWVDSICIIQGSDRSWALNSRVMDQVYGNAYLTICAADGDGAGAGLQILNPERSPGSQAEKNSKEQSLSQNITQYNREIRLMSTQPAENYIRKSVWNTRGWTFQERLLSPRNLIFTAGRMYFQCRCTARSADIITEDDAAGWSIEFKDSPLLMLQKLPTRPLSVYKQALELYMTRQLTQPKDILAAFTGMGNLVCNALGGSLIYGLPSSHFDWALLWEPRDAAVPRPNVGGEKFPSWSWCGWKNQIMEYKEHMLDGCEDNLHDWLMNRTWITWYIRDGNGNLRLVWDGESRTISAQAEATWKGYHLPPDYDEKVHDKFGRYVQECERKTRVVESSKFELILDECPFGVEIVGKPEFDTDARSSSTERDMPYLQFKTWSAFFRIEEDLLFQAESEQRLQQENEKIFRRYSILDYKDDWCGTILLDKFWVELEGRVPTRDLNVPLEFIALSDAKQFGEGEYDAWANYIPMTRKESSWDLYYVMLIETKSDISQRVGLGKVFKEAFENSCRHPKQWKEFILG
jgi:Heterokaryon incompatibility protein (HET)